MPRRSWILLVLAACGFDGSEQLVADAPNPLDPDAAEPIDAIIDGSLIDAPDAPDLPGDATPDAPDLRPCEADPSLLLCFSFDQMPLPAEVPNEGTVPQATARLEVVTGIQRGNGGAAGVGSTSNIRVAEGVALSGILSVDGWFYVADLPQGTGRVGLYDAAGAAPSLSLFYGYQGNVGKELRFDVGAGVNKLNIAHELSLDAWHHIAATCLGTGELVAYVDGAEIGRSQTGICGAVSQASRGLYLGQDNNADVPQERLTGAVDDFRVWSRSLSPTEIAESAASQ